MADLCRRDAALQRRRLPDALRAAAAAVVSAVQSAGPDRRRAELRLQHLGQLRHQHQLAVLRAGNHDELPRADGRADGAQFRLGGDRHRAGAGADPRLCAARGEDDRQFLGRSDPRARSTCCCRSRSSSALFFVWQGMPQNLGAYVDATTLEGAKQTIAQGPVASQEVDQDARHQWRRLLQRQLGASLREPDAADQFHPAGARSSRSAPALTNVLGRMVKDERQGWAIFAAMGVLFLAGVTTAYWAEAHGNPAFAAFNVDQRAERAAGRRQHGRQGGPLRHRPLGALRDRHDRHLVRRRQFDA